MQAGFSMRVLIFKQHLFESVAISFGHISFIIEKLFMYLVFYIFILERIKFIDIWWRLLCYC